MEGLGRDEGEGLCVGYGVKSWDSDEMQSDQP